jgi:hypothetical protein
MSESQHTAIVAAVSEANIDITSWVSDESRHPYHRFTTAEMRYYFVAVWNVDFQATEEWVTAKRTQSVVAEPVCVNRYNLEALVDKKSTQSAP